MPSDAEIIRECGARPLAFEALFDRHHEAIRRYLIRRVGRDDGEELAAEVFTMAFANLHRYDLSRESARPWLYGIAANLVRHYRRSAARGRVAYARAISPSSDDEDWTDDATDRMDADLDAARALELIDELGDTERDVLLLVDWEGLRYSDVALALGVPVGTVRSRLNRARRHLRERMLPDEPPTETGAPA